MASLAKIIPFPVDNTTQVQQIERASKEVNNKEEERSKNMIKSQDKVATNLERLIDAIKTGALGADLAKSADYKKGGTWDQRTVGAQFKEGLMGRAGDKFDPNSMRYKFGSLKGLADTTGLIKEDSFVGNLLGRREDRMRRTDTLTKLNPQMKNLKQFGGDEAKVRAYYDKQYKEQFAPAQSRAQEEQYKLDAMMASGISSEELARTVGGKRQIKSRDEAAANLLSVDKFRMGEMKAQLGKTDGLSSSAIGSSNVIPFKSGSEKETEVENLRMMNDQNNVLVEIRDNTAAMPKLYDAFVEEAKREAKADEEQKTNSANGSGSGLMDMAGSLLGRGKAGASKALPMLKSAGGFLTKRAGPLAAGAAILGGGLTAYQGVSGANEALARGEITEGQATVQRSGAVGEGVGSAAGGVAGALKGAAAGAAIGSVIPVVGTAVGGLIGAAVGGMGGSFLGGKAGKFLGETGGKIKNWFTGANADKSDANAKVQAMAATPSTQGGPSNAQSYTLIGGEKVVDGQPLSKKQMRVIEISTSMGNTYDPKIMAQYAKQKSEEANPQTSTKQTADVVADKSAENASMREGKPAGDVNVATVNNTSVKTANNYAIKPPIRNQDSSYGRMVDRRYAY